MKLLKKAFGQAEEAILVQDLFKDPSAMPTVSLVAIDGDKIVGYILFTRTYLDNHKSQPLMHILAPLAILPGNQDRGIGGKLIEEGLKELKILGSTLVFVLGHESYYTKFGFTADAGALGLIAPYTIPDELAGAWMVQEMVNDAISSTNGKIRVALAMDKPEYWRE